MMGNEVPRVRRRSKKSDKVLYSVSFQPGDIHFENPQQERRHIAIELVFHCERGEVGPLPMSQVAPNEERKTQVWHSDCGNPKYCILVMHRDHLKIFPKWSIQHCTAEVSRKNELVATTFKHTGPVAGGDAMVYSLTMAPACTRTETFTFPTGESDDEEEEEAYWDEEPIEDTVDIYKEQ